jgi:lipid-A-disaccharide synthase
LLDAVRTIVGQVPTAQFIVARAPGLDDRLFGRAAAWEGPGRVSVVDGRTDDALSVADLVVTASGTATIQAAIHGRPMVIIYRVSPLTYALGKRFVHVDTYGMVNLVAGQSIVPELIQDQCTPGVIAAEVVGYLTNDERMRQTRALLDEVRTRLGGAGASRRAAEAVLAVANRAATS